MISRDITTIFFQFMLVFVVFILGVEGIFFFFLKKEKGKIEGKKLHLFGILMELNNSSILAISVLFIRYLFILFSLVTNHDITNFHLICLSVLGLLYGVFTKSFKNTVIEGVSGIFLWAGLVCQTLFVDYLQDVEIVWYVLLGNICFVIFLFLYASFFLFKNFGEIIKNNKYVRRDRNESN